MYEIDNQKFGAFLCALRKEHGMTQKDLAEKLFVSDKAVSKWERGLSLPDISLLQPLADELGVTVTELLAGERIRESEPLSVRDVEPIVRGSLELTAQEQSGQRTVRRRWIAAYLGSLLLGGAGLALALLRWKMLLDGNVTLYLPPLLAAIFGVHFVFFAKERLPSFYDENKINFYSSGMFRMNLPGIRFNNSNWPHILSVARGWCVATLLLWPGIYSAVRLAAVRLSLGASVEMVLLGATLAVTLGGLFIPVYAAGRKYQ